MSGAYSFWELSSLAVPIPFVKIHLLYKPFLSRAAEFSFLFCYSLSLVVIFLKQDFTFYSSETLDSYWPQVLRLCVYTCHGRLNSVLMPFSAFHICLAMFDDFNLYSFLEFDKFINFQFFLCLISLVACLIRFATLEFVISFVLSSWISRSGEMFTRGPEIRQIVKVCFRDDLYSNEVVLLTSLKRATTSKVVTCCVPVGPPPIRVLTKYSAVLSAKPSPCIWWPLRILSVLRLPIATWSCEDNYGNRETILRSDFRLSPLWLIWYTLQAHDDWDKHLSSGI